MSQEKFYYNISELAEMFDIPATTIRFWEKEIKVLSPNRKGGIRQYTQKDVQRFRTAYHLIKEKGLKITAVNRYFGSKNIDEADINAEIVERLEKIKASLQQTLLFLDDNR